MGVETEKYIRKPLYVDAVRVAPQNFDEIASWCQGEVQTEEQQGSGTIKKFIKVRVHNPKNPRQTKAFIGDWILYTERGYKVYTNKAFRAAFDLVGAENTTDVKEYPFSDGDFTVLGPEIFVAEVEGGPVISWKGENFVPQPVPEEQEASLYAKKEDGGLAVPLGVKIEELRPASSETVARAQEKANGAATGADPEFEGVTKSMDAHTTPQGEPHEYVEATPRAIADAVGGHQPIPEQPPEVAAAGKRVLSLEEQEQMGPEEVRELLQTGEVVLAQDLAA